jgi:hypothetical protein
MFREKGGNLRHNFIVPGPCYNQELWDWDSWLTDIALNEIADEDITEYEKGCVLNFLENVREDGWTPVVIMPHRVMPPFDESDITENYSPNPHKPCLAQHARFIIEQTGDALCTDSALIMDYSSGIDTLYVHADSIKLKSFNFGTDSLWRKMDAFFHVRAYRCDVQAVCDSLTFSTLSRVMTLHRDPIVWSDNRQVLGEQIDIHFNDSTIDSVYVCRQALLVEHVDSVHFNQISGHEMRSYYHNGEIKENQVIGNVRVVFFPLEKDSLVLYQVYLETSKLRMLMQDRKLDKLWTPPADGHFYAVGMAPKSESKLENFEWFDYIRPLHKNDIFEWRPKHKGTELKSTIRRQAPLQHLKL